MARSTATIQQNILNTISADPVLGSVLTSTSITSVFRLIAYIIAAMQNLFEQIWDDYLKQIDTYVTQTPAGTPNWIALQAFIYQYDPSGAPATNTLTILPNGALGYATINPAFRIVTRCAVNTTGSNSILIKVAQSTPPALISGTAFTQLDGYFKAKIGAGVNYQLVSAAADFVAIYGTVYYKPGYAGVVRADVESALNNYLSSIAIFSAGTSIPVNYQGLIDVSAVISTIMNLGSVDDFRLSTIKCRGASTIFANATVVYDLATGVNLRKYAMASGYGTQETTASNDWGTTISYTSA